MADKNINGAPLSPMTGPGQGLGAFHLGQQDWTPYISSAWGGAQKPTFDGTAMVCKDSSWFFVSTRFPIAVGMKYKVSISLSKISGTGTFYCGVDSLDANFNSIKNDKATSYNYGTMSGRSLSTGSNAQVFSGTYQWFNSTSGTNHNRFDPGAKYFNVVIITNYNGKGTSHVYGLNVQCIS